MSAAARGPTGGLLLRTLSTDPSQQYWHYTPPRQCREDIVLVAIHGIARDAELHARAWSPLAAALGCVLLAPHFTARGAPGYQRLGWDANGPRADALLDAIVAEACAGHAALPRQVLTGYSGGAQFVHRYALAQPARVRAWVAGAAGWYTLPAAAVAWPEGLARGRGLRNPAVLDLEGFLRLPGLVYVGTRDTLRDPALRSSAELDERQGRDRRARAVRWVAALADAARDRGLPPPARLIELPRVAHEFDAAVAAGVVDTVGRWLADAVPTLAVPDRAATSTPGDVHVRRP